MMCVINPSKKEVNELNENTEVTFLPMTLISKDGIIISRKKRKLKEVIKGFTYFREGDILLAKITPCFENGKRAIATNLVNDIGFGSTEFHVLRPKENVISKWIFFSISRSDFRNEAKNKMTGAVGQKRVPKIILENFEIPLPLKKEQTQIVAEIEKQFTRLDASIKIFKEIKKKLEVYRKSVLKAAFEGKLVEVLEWLELTVNDFGEIVTGTTPPTHKKEYYGVDFCFFKPKDLDYGYNLQKSITLLSNEGIKKARLLPEKSILVTSIGATIGKTGFNRVKGATNQQINSIIPNRERFSPELIYYLFISEEMKRQIKKKASSTTLPILNKSKFKKLSAYFPKNINEQKQIVQEIESRFSVIDKLEETINNALNKSEQLRKSILKSAFEGKLIKIK